MNAMIRNTLAVAGFVLAAQASAQVTFYENEGFQGRSYTANQQVDNFAQIGFNDRASSIIVVGNRWEVCEDARFNGRCVVLRPGRYPSLVAMGLNDRVSSVRSVHANTRVDDNRYAPMPAPAPATAQVTFYENEGFQGQSFSANQDIGNFERFGFNDRASSVVVVGDRWEVCEDSRFNGRCAVLRPGRYPSLAAMGLNGRVSSVRSVHANTRVEDNRYAPMPAPAPATAQVTFYENEGFQGRSFSANQDIGNFERFGFNDRASSVVVVGDRWEVCQDARFGGRCAVLRPGRYPSLAAMGLNERVSSVRSVHANTRIEDNRYAPMPAPVTPQITFFENEGFQGQRFSATQEVRNLRQFGFNDRASSVVVLGDRWEVCEDPRFEGRCVVLRPGSYPSLAAMGLNDSVSSVRTVETTALIDDSRYAPAPGRAYDNRRRNDERIYEATVTSVTAVVAVSGQRCWVEPGQVAQQSSSNAVPGAIIGAIIGGVLGHQVGGGRGKDLATVGGAVGGAVVGANVGRGSGGQTAATPDVKRCEEVPGQARAEYWDVTYNFRGQDHRIQMTSPPGATVTVNAQGEPRV